MKKYLVTTYWSHGFVQNYEITGGAPGSRADIVKSAKEHLESIRNIVGYTIQEETGEIVYEKPANLKQN